MNASDPSSGGFRIRDQFPGFSEAPAPATAAAAGSTEAAGPPRRPAREGLPPLRPGVGMEGLLKSMDWSRIARGVWRKRFVVLALVAVCAALGFAGGRHMNRTRYDTRVSFLYRADRQKQILSASGITFTMRGLARPTSVSMIRRGHNMESVVTNLQLTMSVDELKWMTETKSEKNSEIVLLDVKGAPSARLATGIANELARVAIEDNLEFYRDQARSAASQYRQHADEARRELDALDQLITAFQATNHIMEASADTQAFYDSIAAATERLSAARIAHQATVVRIENYRKMIADMPAEVPRESYEDNPVKRRIMNSEVALMEARSKYGPENPRVRALEDEIKEMRRMVADKTNEQSREQVFEANPVRRQFESDLLKLEADRGALEKNVQDLSAELADIEKKFAYLPRQQLEFSSLQQRRTSAQDIYQALHKSADHAALAADLDLADFEILEPARDASAHGSTLAVALPILAIFLGGFGGLAGLFLVEFLDTRLRTRRQLELAYQGAAVHHVLRHPDLGPGNAYAHFLPLCRKIYEEWSRWTAETPCRSIAVVSSVRGEGKSSVAYHLARYFASLRVNTAYVDFESAANPWLETGRFRRGVESYLRECADWSDLPADHDGLTCLKVLQPTPDLLELCNSAAMARFREALSRAYDLVVLEAPGLADDRAALAVAGQCDRTVFVVGSPVVTRATIDASLDDLDRAGWRPDALVLNLADPFFADRPQAASDAGRGWGARLHRLRDRLSARGKKP